MRITKGRWLIDNNDIDMIEKLKNKDPESFTDLFGQYGNRIYSLAFRMCASREDAEDIVQNTFIQAMTHIESFKGESGVYTWLFSIARNLCLRHLEQRKKGSFSYMLMLIDKAKSPCPDNFTVLEKRYYIGQVKDGCLLGLLGCLPLNQRMAFILCVLLGMKTRDVAAVIGKTENAVRLLVFRAKQSLKGFICKNCSLYDKDNPCRCENLINFSMKQGWIKRADKNDIERSRTVIEIENEIESLKRIVKLYDTLDEGRDSGNTLKLLREAMEKGTSVIFSDKKVK